MANRFEATAAHQGGWWAVTIPVSEPAGRRTLEQAGPQAASMVTAQLHLNPSTVTVAVRAQLDAELAVAVEQLQAAALKRDEDPHQYAEANLHGHRLFKEHGIAEAETDAILGGLARAAN